MPRKPRLAPAGVTQHVIQRGNNRQLIFRDNQDRALFTNWLAQYSRQHAVQIHAWVYMSNHIHVLATPQREQGLPHMMQSLGRQYVRYFNQRYQRSGTLFEGRYKSCLVGSDHYVLACYRYIEMNPVRACMVANPGDYVWSSYLPNAHGAASGMLTPHPAFLGLGASAEARQTAYRGLFRLPENAVSQQALRLATQQGYVFGDGVFTEAMEKQFGVRLRPGRRGRPGIQGKDDAGATSSA